MECFIDGKQSLPIADLSSYETREFRKNDWKFLCCIPVGQGLNTKWHLALNGNGTRIRVMMTADSTQGDNLIKGLDAE